MKKNIKNIIILSLFILFSCNLDNSDNSDNSDSEINVFNINFNFVPVLLNDYIAQALTYNSLDFDDYEIHSLDNPYDGSKSIIDINPNHDMIVIYLYHTNGGTAYYFTDGKVNDDKYIDCQYWLSYSDYYENGILNYAVTKNLIKEIDYGWIDTIDFTTEPLIVYKIKDKESNGAINVEVISGEVAYNTNGSIKYLESVLFDEYSSDYFKVDPEYTYILLKPADYSEDLKIKVSLDLTRTEIEIKDIDFIDGKYTSNYSFLRNSIFRFIFEDVAHCTVDILFTNVNGDLSSLYYLYSYDPWNSRTFEEDYSIRLSNIDYYELEITNNDFLIDSSFTMTITKIE